MSLSEPRSSPSRSNEFLSSYDGSPSKNIYAEVSGSPAQKISNQLGNLELRLFDILKEIDDARMDLRILKNDLVEIEVTLGEEKDALRESMVNEIKYIQDEFTKMANRDIKDFSIINTQFMIINQEKSKMQQVTSILEERVRQSELVVGFGEEPNAE